jgi:hypothetical protein
MGNFDHKDYKDSENIMHLIKNFLIDPVRVFAWLAGVLIALATLIACKNYVGNVLIYLSFSIISNSLLYLGFRRRALFFDSAIGVFMWLGFWVKLTARLIFFGGVFTGFSGGFDGSGNELDYGLLVSCVGIFALIVASLIRSRYFYYHPKEDVGTLASGLLYGYIKHRKKVLGAFSILVIFVAVVNIHFGIYQRGQVPSTILPYGLGGIFKWLLQFGLASFGAVILQLEYVNRRATVFTAGLLVLLEGFVSNVSLLSRGMILNSTATFYGLFKSFSFNSVRLRFRFFSSAILAGCLLLSLSVVSVNYLRFNTIENTFSSPTAQSHSIYVVKDATRTLFTDRWVGLEGVLAVTSSHRQGWKLWRDAWSEVYSEHSTSFYDLNLIDSPYLTADTNIHHYISLPGILAFCFYPGSFLFLFVAMLLVGFIGAVCEIFVYKFSGRNLILCSLLAQVVAYRFLSFGYVPAQSYLLFGSLFLNVGIIYCAEVFLSKRISRAKHANQ